jgi:hypothetical protein
LILYNIFINNLYNEENIVSFKILNSGILINSSLTSCVLNTMSKINGSIIVNCSNNDSLLFYIKSLKNAEITIDGTQISIIKLR